MGKIIENAQCGRVSLNRGLSLHRYAALTLLILLFSLTFGAPRDFASDFLSPRTAALGGAGHAGPLLNDAIYVNDSYISLLPTFSVAGNYGWGNYSDGSYKYRLQNASIQDGNPTDLFQAGIAYTKRDDGTPSTSAPQSRSFPQNLPRASVAKPTFQRTTAPARHPVLST